MRRVGAIHHAHPVGDAEAGGDRHRNRIGPGRSLLLVPALAATAWALLIGGFAAISQVFGPDDEGGSWAEVAGAAFGNFVMAFVVALVVSVFVRAAGRSASTTTDEPVDGGASPPAAGESLAEIRPERSRSREPSRIVRGAVLGALPGFLIVVVPVVLHELDVISSDQSQIGFMGLPILVIGAFVGIAAAASDSGGGTSAVLGGLAGFVVGLVVGVFVSIAIPGVGLVSLLFALVGMISGAALATRAHARHREQPRHG